MFVVKFIRLTIARITIHAMMRPPSYSLGPLSILLDPKIHKIVKGTQTTPKTVDMAATAADSYIHTQTTPYTYSPQSHVAESMG